MSGPPSQHPTPVRPTPPAGPVAPLDARAFLRHVERMRVEQRQRNRDGEQQRPAQEEPSCNTTHTPTEHERGNDGGHRGFRDFDLDMNQREGLPNTNHQPGEAPMEMAQPMSPSDVAMYSRPVSPPPSPPSLQRYVQESFAPGNPRAVYQLCEDESGRRRFVRREMLMLRPQRVFPEDGSESPRADYMDHEML